MPPLVIFAMGRMNPAIFHGASKGGPPPPPRVPVVREGPKEFTRAVVTGRPKPISLAPGSTGTTETVFFSTRAGIQVRTAAIETTKFITLKTPVAVYRSARYAVRSLARDTLAPYHGVVHGYQFARAGRAARGVTTKVERTLDAYVMASGRFLNRAGLAPSLRGSVATGVRVAIVGAVIKGTDIVSDRVKALEVVIDEFRSKARRAAGEIPVPNIPITPSPRSVEISVPALPVPTRSTAPQTPVPVLPVPTKPATIPPVEIPPPMRRRR